MKRLFLKYSDTEKFIWISGVSNGADDKYIRDALKSPPIRPAYLKGSAWYKNRNCWGILAKSQQELEKFAQKNNIILDWSDKGICEPPQKSAVKRKASVSPKKSPTKPPPKKKTKTLPIKSTGCATKSRKDCGKCDTTGCTWKSLGKTKVTAKGTRNVYECTSCGSTKNDDVVKKSPPKIPKKVIKVSPKNHNDIKITAQPSNPSISSVIGLSEDFMYFLETKYDVIREANKLYILTSKVSDFKKIIGLREKDINIKIKDVDVINSNDKQSVMILNNKNSDIVKFCLDMTAPLDLKYFQLLNIAYGFMFEPIDLKNCFTFNKSRLEDLIQSQSKYINFKIVSLP